MNNKGFTMVELLVAMAIMGLLVIMAFPTIRAVQTNNTNTKYQEYGNAAVSAAKLYADSYGEDLFFPDNNSSFSTISFKDLAKKDLIKDINVSGATCVNNSEVRIVKYNDTYDYCLNLHCFAGGKEVYTETDKKGSCKGIAERSRTVTYEYKGKTYSFSVIAGDDSYKLLDPNSMPDFNFNANKEKFIGWSLDNNPTSSSTNYKKGSIYPHTINNDITFHAYAEKWKYKINYKKNSDGTYDGSMAQTVCTLGKPCPLRGIGFSRYGYHFVKWQMNSSTSFANGEDVSNRIGSNVKYDGQQFNLTAIFEINKYTITLGAGTGIASLYINGENVASKVVKHGDSVTISAGPYDYYHFINWSDGYAVNARTFTATSDVYLVATGGKNKLTLQWDTNGGTLQCSGNNKSCKGVVCSSGSNWASLGCTGNKTGIVASHTYSLGNTEFSDYGLFDHNGSTGTLYMTKSGKTATNYWHVGSYSIHEENDKFANMQVFAEKVGYGESIKTNANTVITIYAGWK